MSPADWCVLHMSGDQVSNNGKQLADYPMVGFTENRVTLATNQFGYTNAPFVGGFKYVQIVSFRKAQLYDCSVPVVPIKVFSRTQTKDPDGSPAFTIVPAISFGGAPTTQYMTSIDFNGSTGKLILWRLKVGERRAQADAGVAGRWGDGLSALRSAMRERLGPQHEVGHRRSPLDVVLL